MLFSMSTILVYNESPPPQYIFTMLLQEILMFGYISLFDECYLYDI